MHDFDLCNTILLPEIENLAFKAWSTFYNSNETAIEIQLRKYEGLWGLDILTKPKDISLPTNLNRNPHLQFRNAYFTTIPAVICDCFLRLSKIEIEE